ncbi:MAG: response regulator receiver protein [Acidobacteriaceae bacterium]|nr:response regulator receiver protein [Acidobacteriaceae bacterium]
MEQAKLTRKRLLFVDDEPAIRKTLSVILARYGFAVTVAGTVAEAIDEVKTKEFDLLLSDLNIDREGDGYEVIRAMREVNPDCVTIVLTGHPDVESAVEGLHLGVDDYIMKPAKADVLVALLAEKLAARKAKARILSVSYDQTLLRMRHMLFETQGYEVVSSHGLMSSLEHCEQGSFDLFVLGHSIPDEDKKRLVQAFRKVCPAPIISLRRTVGDQKVDGADYHIETDPEPLLKLVADVIRKRAAAHQ